jgi:hypothetical protein
MAAPAQGLLKQSVFIKQSGLGVPGAGAGGQILRRVSSVFALARDTYDANEIVTHQMSTGSTAGIKKTTGKLDGLLSPGTYSKFFAALLRADFAAGTPLTSIAVTISGSGPTYTVALGSGSYLTNGFKIGDIIRLTVGTLNAANISKNLMITAIGSATSATVVPLNGVALVAEGPIAGCTLTVIGKKSKTPLTGHTNDYFTYEEFYADKTLSDLFTDVKVAKADVSLPPTGNATVSFDMPGLGRTLGAAQVLTSPTAVTTTNVLTAVNAIIWVNGVATPVTGVQMSIMGNIQPGAAEVGSNNISDHQRGEVACTGQFTAKFTASTLQALYDAQTIISLSVVVADGTAAAADFIGFTIPALKLFGDAPNDGEAVEIIRTYPFIAQINSAGGAALSTDQTLVSVQDSQAA